MRSWRARPDSPVPCSHSGSSSSNGSVSSSQHSKPDGRGHHYELTSAGHDLFAVCQSLGEWGARWLEIAPENLDPFVALWSMCNALHRDRLPDRRVVIRFDFTGRPRRERYWLLIELGDTEICKTNPGTRRGPLHHGGRRSLRQMARRPAHLGPSHPRRPHPTRRLAVARKSLPNLERPQHVRAHQAGLPHRHERQADTSTIASKAAITSSAPSSSRPRTAV